VDNQDEKDILLDDDKDLDEELNVKEQRTKDLIRQILSALSHMHGKTFVHKGI
jgi:serine/threonine protein kinase